MVEFLRETRERGVYVVDFQFGRVGCVGKDFSPAMNTRTDAVGATYLIEIL